MFASNIRHHLHVRNASLFRAGFSSRRQLSVISTHTSFPATLYRFQTQRSSGLSDYKQSGDGRNGVELSDDGLVRPRVSIDLPCRIVLPFLSCLKTDTVAVSNGAVFMPYTFTMQEWVRTYFDDYLEGLKDGRSASDASILSVRKGMYSPSYDVKVSI